MAYVTTALFGQVVLLPIPAETPVTEKLSWKTQILTSIDGSEQPVSLRPIARRNFSFVYSASNLENNRAFNVLYGERISLWAVPLWTEAQNIGVVSPGASSVSVSTNYYDFRSDSLALLWESPRNWQIVEIQSLTSTELNLYNTTNSFTNAWVMPVRQGYLKSDPKRTHNSFNGNCSIEFEINDIEELSVSAPTQFLSNDIYYDEVLYKGSSFSENLNTKVDVLDEQLGPIVFRTSWTNAKVSSPIVFITNEPNEIYTLRQFFQRRLGKYRKFWQPSFNSDFRVSDSGAIATQLVVMNDDYSHSDGRNHIAIETKDGTWYPRTIDSYSAASGTEIELTLDTALNINAEDITRICYLGLKRFASDDITLQWNGGGVVETSIGLIEVSA